MSSRKKKIESENAEPLWGPGWSSFFPESEVPSLNSELKIPGRFDSLNPLKIISRLQMRRERESFEAKYPPGPPLDHNEFESKEIEKSAVEDLGIEELIGRFLESEETRYEQQAIDLINQKRLRTVLGNLTLFYELRRGWCLFGVTESDPENAFMRSLAKVRGKKQAKVNSLVFIFAQNEARAFKKT